MDRVAQEHGAAFLLYHHPDVAAIWEPFIEDVLDRSGIEASRYDRYAFERRLQTVAQDSGVAFCPVIGHFISNQARGPFHLLPRDYHCNPVGYELTAEVIVECLTNGVPFERRLASG